MAAKKEVAAKKEMKLTNDFSGYCAEHDDFVLFHAGDILSEHDLDLVKEAQPDWLVAVDASLPEVEEVVKEDEPAEVVEP